MSNTVERKIYFYRVDAGRDKNGNQVAFDPIPTLNHINGLGFIPSGRYYDDAEGNGIVCWVDETNPLAKIRLGKIRRRGLPDIEQAGNLTDLNLPSGSGLAEQTHLVFFSHNLVGADFNFYAPRATSLKYYFADKAKGICPPITIEPLLNLDTLTRLEKLNDIRLFDLKLDVPSAAALAAADTDLGSLLNKLIELGYSDTMEIILKPQPYSRGTISSRLLAMAKKIVNRQQLVSNSSSLAVSGMSSETGVVDYFDVLSDRFVAKKKIVLMNANARTLNHRAAYAAIEEAYGELEAELLKAVGIRP